MILQVIYPNHPNLPFDSDVGLSEKYHHYYPILIPILSHYQGVLLLLGIRFPTGTHHPYHQFSPYFFFRPYSSPVYPTVLSSGNLT